MQNGDVESFNTGSRDECLNEHLDTLAEARQIIAAWRDHYKQVRPTARFLSADGQRTIKQYTTTIQT